MSDNEPLPTITTRYETELAVVRLVGPVTVPSILQLCDEIDLAIGYYQYTRLDIELDSPGGDVAALEYLITRWRAWRARPAVRIGTLALTSAASAAAMILSLGDIGLRRAYPSTRLLYHDARLSTNAGMQTRAELAARQAMLNEIDTRLLDRLTAHVWHGIESHDVQAPQCALEAVLSYVDAPRARVSTSSARADGRDASSNSAFSSALVTNEIELRALYTQLNALDQFIPPAAARQLALIDTIVA